MRDVSSQDIAGYFQIRDKISESLRAGNVSFEAQRYEAAEASYVQVITFAQMLDVFDYEALKISFYKIAEIYIHKASSLAGENKLNDSQYILVKAAALLNTAINVVKLDPSKTDAEKIAIIENLRTKITEIDELFLHVSGIRHNPYAFRRFNQEHRDQLTQIRDQSHEKLSRISWQDGMTCIKDLSESVTRSMQSFIIRLWEECITTIGVPPCAYAMIAFGSMARGEMTPYSDFEWGILLQDPSAKNKQYFRTLTNLLYLKVVNLGETILPAINVSSLEGLDDYITPRGFTFDGQMSHACKTPLGNKWLDPINGYELLGSPAELACLHDEAWYQKDHLLSNEIAQFILVTGIDAKKLVDEYQLLVNQKLPQSVRKARTLSLLTSNIEFFSCNLREENEEGKLYQVKKDLYRLPNIIFDELGYYYELQRASLPIEFKSSWSKIQEMQTVLDTTGRPILSKTAAENIARVLNVITALRLHTYYHNKGQLENMCASSFVADITPFGGDEISLDSIKKIFCLDNLDCIFLIYRTLLPLQAQIKEFILKQEIGNLTGDLLDRSDYTTGLIYKRLMQYSSAKYYFERALVTTPSLEIQISMGNVLSKMHKFAEAILVLKEAYRQYQRSITTELLINLGTIYYYKGEYNEALQMHTMALTSGQINIKVLRDYTVCIMNLGMICGKLGRNQEALENLWQTLGVSIEPRETELKELWQGLGDSLGHDGMSLEQLWQSLNITRCSWKGRIPFIATLLNNIGVLLFNSSNIVQNKMAIAYFKKAYHLRISIYGFWHPQVAELLTNMALFYAKHDVSKDIESYHYRAYVIDVKLYGCQHNSVATDLNNLGLVLYDKQATEAAVKLFLKALRITKNVVGIWHNTFTDTLNNLGISFYRLREDKEAAKCFELSIIIDQKIFADWQNARVQKTISLLQTVMREPQQRSIVIARELFSRVVAEINAIYETLHNELAELYTYVIIDSNKARVHHEQALLHNRSIPLQFNTIRNSASDIRTTTQNPDALCWPKEHHKI